MKSVSAVDLLRLREVADAEAGREDDLAVLDQSDGNAGYTQLIPRALDERREVRDARCVERTGRPAGKGLAMIALRKEAAEDERDLCEALFRRGLRHVDDERPSRLRRAVKPAPKPRAVRSATSRKNTSADSCQPSSSATGVATLSGHFASARYAGPCRRHGGVGVGGLLDVHERDVRVVFRSFEDGRGAAHHDRPSRRGDERGAHRGGLRGISGECLGTQRER